MFYYAEIDSEYLVVNTHSLTVASTNENYIAITEEQYNSGALIGFYYNKLFSVFEYVSDYDYMGNSNWVTHKDTRMPLSTKIDNLEADIRSMSGGDADNNYASVDDIALLTDIVNTKADANHEHSEYALSSHAHSEYATQEQLEFLGGEIAEKAGNGHEHDNYAPIDHWHEDYAYVDHAHDNYADIDHEHDYASTDHSHSATDIGAADIDHNHDNEYAAVNHSHDEYYTGVEIDAKLEDKAAVSHNHNGVYDVIGAAVDALVSANAYTDSKIDALVGEGASTTLDTIGEISAAIEGNQDAIDLLNAAIGTKANVSDLNYHANDTEMHISQAERNAWNAKSNFSGNYNDLTNKPAIPSISGLATEIYVDQQINAISIPGALSDLTSDSNHRVVTDVEKAVWNSKSNFSGNYNDLTNKPTIPSIAGLASEDYVDEAVSAKAHVSHSHSIANITDLQSALDGKQAIITGGASTIAGSNLTANRALVSNGSGKVGVSEVTATELGYLDGVKSNVQTQLDGKAASSHAHGLLHSDLTKTIDDTTTNSGWSMINSPYRGFILKSLRTNKTAPEWILDNYAAGVAFGGADTKGVLSHAYNSPKVRFAGGHGDTPVWNFTLQATSGQTYILPSETGTVALTSSNITGNAATATNVAWSGVTNKPSYYDAKAIKSISRNGTTFTYTCMDGTTGTFTQQDNNTTYSAATTSAAGLMSAEDKIKLNGIATGANKITVDSAMSATSTNPVQNKVVKAAISNIALTVNNDGVLMLSV